MTPAPGPYGTLEVGCGASFHQYVTDASGRKIAVVWGPVAEKVWTAALMAAAPRLLDIAKTTRIVLKNRDQTEHEAKLVAVINEVIANVEQAPS